MPMKDLALIVPPAVLVMGLVLYWRPQTTNEKKLKLFSLWFYGATAAMFVLLYIDGTDIDLGERQFHSVGILLFVCALSSASAGGNLDMGERLVPRFMRAHGALRANLILIP